mgnify:CR=1 FL=1
MFLSNLLIPDFIIDRMYIADPVGGTAAGYYHPTFLYESVWCLLGFVVLFIVCQKFHKFDGQLILGYGIIYGLERTVVEGLRTDSLYIAGTTIRVSQALSAALVVVCAALLVILLIKYTKNEFLNAVFIKAILSRSLITSTKF